ncbi:orotidine-5'-phosphate decarboxylase [Aurantimicrobium sp. MWH-Uga1]|uniref:orotidine-5'-phosphate decarboxylase n=1 Tax=Aurantimicrobium sp. MWH-Uga1 TaxID=2079575 RepID=UPI000DEDC7D6|nr:orotidine-5'-phosphate decarboxylase [Aurantimicrobium sp. MWH-Uga1]AXE54544.1 orotidine 5'-phosphate decarboxylase [Aurantimicrobium sp. MWH-Uga1]
MNELGFGDRLQAAFQQFGHLCVGIDPHPFLLNEWEFDDTFVSLREFSLRVIDACVGHVGIIKPQVAFYERHGAKGMEALEYIIRRAREAGLLVISDCKRGDIGSTMEAYAQAWLTPGWNLESDAITVSPYLGSGALSQTVDYALSNNKGVFILAATSNPEAALLQTAQVTQGVHQGKTVAAAMLSDVARWATEATPHNSVGAVLGATLNLPSLGIQSDDYPALPVLAPGFGFQGARVEDAKSLFGNLSTNLIVSETRSVLSAGREGVVESVTRRAGEVASALA